MNRGLLCNHTTLPRFQGYNLLASSVAHPAALAEEFNTVLTVDDNFDDDRRKRPVTYF